MSDLQYPIGKYISPERVDIHDRERAIASLAEVPQSLRRAVADLSAEQIDTPYRPGGWTVRQVVHHLPDSHVNGYTRLKLALTESVPTIRTYEEALWAELPDNTAPIELSLQLLAAVHERWVYLFEHLDAAHWQHHLLHPEAGQMRVDTLLTLYAWHGQHHVAHITSLRERRGW